MGEILRSFSKPKKSQNAFFWRENMFKALGDFSKSGFCGLYNQSHDVPTPPLPLPNCCFNDVNQVLYITHVLQVVSLTSKDYEVALHMKKKKKDFLQ